MTPPAAVVFLLDVDNTLLDNDRIIAELHQHLRRAFASDTGGSGAERAERYWTIFEQRRAEVGYADYLGALQRYRAENPRDPSFQQISFFLLDYPFADRLYPRSLEVESRYPAGHYVLVDDKLRILTAVKKLWGPRVTTVFPRQGHYAHDPEILAAEPPADISIDSIGDPLRFDLDRLLSAGRGVTTSRPASSNGERP